MNAKLFFSTFVLIFIAELGDKTQLAAMARAAAGEGGKWTVFLSASSALVLSTLIAVAFGAALTRIVPEVYIKMAAGILFILFGILILGEVLLPSRMQAAAARGGVMSRVALQMAAQFEKAAVDDYQRLAREASDPTVRALMEALAQEEALHLSQVKDATSRFEEAPLTRVQETELPALEDLLHNVSQRERPILEHAIEHEMATARFYTELARDTAIPGLRQTFLALARQEQEHIAHLESLARDKIA